MPLDRACRPPLFILVAVAAIGPMALNIFIPSMPRLQASMGVDYATVQLTLTLYLVGVAVAQLFIGSLSDRFGRRPILLAGLALFVIGSLMCAFAPSIGLLIAGRLVQAVGGCAGLVLGRAIARDLLDHTGATRLVAHITMAMVVAPMIAPAIGGFLDGWFGWRAGFVVVTLLGALVLLAAQVSLHETHHERHALPRFAALRRDYGALLCNPDFLGHSAHAALSSGMFFAFLAGAPYVTVNIIGASPAVYGLYFVLVSVGYMLGNFTTSRLVGVIPPRRLVMIGSWVGLSAALLLWLLAYRPVLAPIAYFGPMALIAFANGLTLPNSLVAAVGREPRLAGTASGLAGFLQMGLGGALTVLVGALQTDTPLPMATVMLVCGLLALLATARARSERDGL